MTKQRVRWPQPDHFQRSSITTVPRTSGPSQAPAEALPTLACALTGLCSLRPLHPRCQPAPSAPSPQGALSGAHYLMVSGSGSHPSSGPAESVWSPAPVPVRGTQMALIPKMNPPLPPEEEEKRRGREPFSLTRPPLKGLWGEGKHLSVTA